MEITSGIAAPILAAGAAATLAFIVTLILGIVLLSLLYVGSAIVVLERFARVSTRSGWMLFFGLVVSGVLGLVGLRLNNPEVSAQPWAQWFEAYAAASARIAGLCLVALLATRFALGRVEGRSLGLWVLALVSFGLATWLSIAVPLGWMLAPLLLSFVGALWLARRRRAREQPTRGELEDVLRWFALPWAVGFLNSFAPLETRETLAGGGAVLVTFFIGIVLLGLLPLAAAGLVEMRRSVEWFIALRYLVAKRRQVFISAISAICVGGIAAGVCLIIVVLSVMNGFEATWRDEILGNRAHFTVHNGIGSFGEYDEVLDRDSEVCRSRCAACRISGPRDLCADDCGCRDESRKCECGGRDAARVGEISAHDEFSFS